MGSHKFGILFPSSQIIFVVICIVLPLSLANNLITLIFLKLEKSRLVFGT